MFRRRKDKQKIKKFIDDQINSSTKLDIEQLDTLAVEYKLVDFTTKYLSKQLGIHFLKMLTLFIEDQVINDDEKLQFDNELKRFGLTKKDHPEYHFVEEYHGYYKLMTNDLQPIDCDINLKRGEECYYTSPCVWNEFRRITKGVQYAGPQVRIKIAKGVYYRIGQYNGRRITSDEMTLIDEGQIYITNKRVIFMGAFGNKSITLDKIFTLEEYSDGIYIQKETGKSPYLNGLTYQRNCNIILSRVLNK